MSVDSVYQSKPKLDNLSNEALILNVTCHSRKYIDLVGTRGISGKNLYVPDPKKPKPFPYVTRNYNMFWQAVDKTTLKLDENSKLVGFL